KPLGDFFKENVIDKMGNLVKRLFNSIGSMLGNILSAPFKVIEFAFAGTIDGKTPEEYNDEKDREREDKRRERREKNRDRRMNRAAQSWKRLFGGGSTKAAAPEETGGEETTSAEGTPDAEVAEASKDAKKKHGLLYKLLHLGREDIPAKPYDYSGLYKDQKAKTEKAADENTPSMGVDTETEAKAATEEEKIKTPESTEETSTAKTSGTDDERERLRRSQEAKVESKTPTPAESVTEEE